MTNNLIINFLQPVKRNCLTQWQKKSDINMCIACIASAYPCKGERAQTQVGQFARALLGLPVP